MRDEDAGPPFKQRVAVRRVEEAVEEVSSGVRIDGGEDVVEDDVAGGSVDSTGEGETGFLTTCGQRCERKERGKGEIENEPLSDTPRSPTNV